MTAPEAAGALSDPHTAHVAASYVLTALGLAGLALMAWLSARRWARRQKAAAAAEARLKGETDG
jgi:hypothetical protein